MAIVTEVFIKCSDFSVEGDGLNLRMLKADNEDTVEFIIIDDGAKNLFPSFEIKLDDLIKTIEILRITWEPYFTAMPARRQWRKKL